MVGLRVRIRIGLWGGSLLCFYYNIPPKPMSISKVPYMNWG